MNKFSETRIDRVFHNTDSAHAYYDQLIERGYNKDDITLLMSKETKEQYYDSTHQDMGSEALKGAGAGGDIIISVDPKNIEDRNYITGMNDIIYKHDGPLP